jgi:hypothetical protein
MRPTDLFHANKRSLMWGLMFAATSFVMTACGNKKEHHRSHFRDSPSTDSNNARKQDSAMQKNYAGLAKKLKGAHSKYIVNMSPMTHDDHTIYSVKNVAKLDTLFERADNHEIDFMDAGVDMLTMFEGLRNKAYKDNLGKKTIGIGVLLPPPGSHNGLVKQITKLAGHSNYKAIYDGHVALPDEAVRELTRNALGEKGGFVDVLDKQIKHALKNHTDLDADQIAPCHKLMLLSMTYQCPGLLKDNPKHTDSLLRVLCDKDADADVTENAMGKMVTFYEYDKLLKLQASSAFKHERNVLVNRGHMLHNAVVGDAAGAMSVETIAAQLHALQRDELGQGGKHAKQKKGGQVIAILEGNQDENASLQAILGHPACNFEKDADIIVVQPLAHVLAHKKRGDMFFTVIHPDGDGTPDIIEVSKTMHYYEGIKPEAPHHQKSPKANSHRPWTKPHHPRMH